MASTSRSIPISQLAEQTKLGKQTYFGAEEPNFDRKDLVNDKGNRRYLAIASALAGKNENGNIKQRTDFKIPRMTAPEWVVINQKAWPLPFYAAFGLMAAPPLGKRCATCAKEHGRVDVCDFIKFDEAELRSVRENKLNTALTPCNYSFCTARGKHAIQGCPTLNHRCTACLF
jgi:hypothetical protein